MQWRIRNENRWCITNDYLDICVTTALVEVVKAAGNENQISPGQKRWFVSVINEQNISEKYK